MLDTSIFKYYLYKGWSVIPVTFYFDKKENKYKKDFPTGWKEYQKRLPTEEEIGEWVKNYKPDGIAVITGKISGLTVVDIDDQDFDLGITSDLISQTAFSKGRHYFYKWDGEKSQVRIKDGDKELPVDIRGNNSLAVIPPSEYEGHQYKWLVDTEYKDLPPLPDKIKKILQSTTKDKGKFDLELLKGSSQGSRNQTAAQVIGKLLNSMRMDDWNELGWEMVRLWNSQNQPPLDDDELQRTFESIANAELNERNSTATVYADKLESENNSTAGMYAPSNTQWKELSKESLIDTLGATIKEDNTNKLIVFLAMLLAFTENSQLNVSFNAPSSSGKSYLSLEIASLFPRDTVMEISYASPTAFYHSNAIWDEERRVSIVDLERKILVFTDMPHTLLLEKLRSLLSHDRKELLVKITDRSKRGQHRAKDIILRGFPSVIFSSASFKMDEQEMTRFLLLSPETSSQKIRRSITEAIMKDADSETYFAKLNANPKRQELIQRIVDIQAANVQHLIIPNHEEVASMFFARHKSLKPRHARDVKRISSIIKGFALLNLWQRKHEDDFSVVYANQQDVADAFIVWDEISHAQELGVSPYVYQIYEEVFWQAFIKNGAPVQRKEVQQQFYDIYRRHLPERQLRSEIIPMLEIAGLIVQEQDPDDKRVYLIRPMLNPKEDGIHPRGTISSPQVEPKKTATKDHKQSQDAKEIANAVKNYLGAIE